MHDKNGTLKLKSSGRLWNCWESLKELKKKVWRDIETRQAENAQTEMIKMCTIDGKKVAIKMKNLVPSLEF